MSRSIEVSPLLRFALRLDAVASAATGLLLSFASAPLAALFEVPAALLLGAGLFCVPYAALVGWMSAHARLPALGVWAVIVGNVGWAMACAVLAVDVTPKPTLLGAAFLLAQAGAVGGFALLQFLGMRRATTPVTATAQGAA